MSKSLIICNNHEFMAGISSAAINVGIDIDIAVAEDQALRKLETGDFDVILVGSTRDSPSFCVAARRVTDAVIIGVVRMRQSVDRLALKKALLLGGADYCLSADNTEDVIRHLTSAIDMIRRVRGESKGMTTLGMLEFRHDVGDFYFQNSKIKLTANESDVLVNLFQHQRRPVNKDRLISLWPGATEKAIEVTVSRIRKKISPAGLCVRHIAGVGYELQADERSQSPSAKAAVAPERRQLPLPFS